MNKNGINDEGYKKLAGQVLLKAINDYSRSNNVAEKEKILKWIRKDMGGLICEVFGLDPEVVINKMRNQTILSLRTEQKRIAFLEKIKAKGLEKV